MHSKGTRDCDHVWCFCAKSDGYTYSFDYLLFVTPDADVAQYYVELAESEFCASILRRDLGLSLDEMNQWVEQNITVDWDLRKSWDYADRGYFFREVTVVTQ